MKLGKEQVEEVNFYIYLDHKIDSVHNIDKEILHRTAAWLSFNCVKTILQQHGQCQDKSKHLQQHGFSSHNVKDVKEKSLGVL